KAADVFVGTQESVLCEVIGERDVRSGELAKQASHTRLMPSDQLAESVLIIINKNSRDEVCIGQLHGRRLSYRRRIVLLSFQLPHQEITRANQEWNNPDAPRAALPPIHGSKKDHKTDANHGQHNPTAYVRPLALCRCRRREQSGRHWLALFNHQLYCAMHHAVLRKTEIHDHRNNQNWGAKDRQENDSNKWNNHCWNILTCLCAIGVGFAVSYRDVEMPFLFLPNRLLYFALRRGSRGDSRRCCWCRRERRRRRSLRKRASGQRHRANANNE